MSKSDKPDFESFRTPSHPLMERVLGRAVWNFVYLEELSRCCGSAGPLWRGQPIELDGARTLTGGDKEDALQSLRKQLAATRAPRDLLCAVDMAIAAFRHTRSEWRNALTHAMGMSAGYDADALYMPGLGIRSKKLGDRDIRGPEALLEEAHRIDYALGPLGEARTAINEFIGGA